MCVCVLYLQGDNLDSVESSEVSVTVGGEECVKTASSLRESDIICTAPSEPPNGQNQPTITVRLY